MQVTAVDQQDGSILAETGEIFPELIRTGDPEIDENLRTAKPEQGCFITGMDEVTGVGWLYHTNQVFFYRYAPERMEFDKMYILNHDLSRSSQIAIARPIFFEGAMSDKPEVYAVLTTTREIITIKLFSTYPVEKSIKLIPELAPTERLINSTSATRVFKFGVNHNDHQGPVHYRYACATNLGNLFVHNLTVTPTPDRSKSILSSKIQHISGTNPSSSSSGQGIFSSLFSHFVKPQTPKPQQPGTNLSRVKLTLDQSSVMTLLTDRTIRQDELHFTDSTCSIKNILKLPAADLVSEFEIQEILDNVLVQSDHTTWTVFSLGLTNSSLILVEDVRQPDQPNVTRTSKVFDFPLVDQDDAESRSVSSFGEPSEREHPKISNAHGKIVIFQGSLYVVVGVNQRTLLFLITLGAQGPKLESQQTFEQPPLGLSVFKLDKEKVKLAFFTQDGIRISQLATQTKNSARDWNQHPPRYFPSAHSLRGGMLPTVQTIPTREAEDLLLNAFYSFENERSNGILSKTICWPDLTEIVQGIITKYSNSLTSNLAAIQATGGRRTSQPNSEESFLVFDLEQRTKRVAKFYQLLERNSLFDKMDPSYRFDFLRAFESLAAAIALATQHEKHPDFFNAVTSIRELRVYETPLRLPEVLLSLIEGTVGLKDVFRGKTELVFQTVSKVFSNIEAARFTRRQQLRIRPEEPLPLNWWIHHSDLWLSHQLASRNLPVLFQAGYSHHHIVSRETQTNMSEALIPELESILKVHSGSVVHSTFLYELYDGLINDGLLDTAFKIALKSQNFNIMARMLLKPAIQKIHPPASIISKVGNRFVEVLINTAVKVILSEDDTGDQQNGAVALLSVKTPGDLIENFLSANYPQIYWLILAEQQKFEEALKIVPSSGLEALSFHSMMSACVERPVAPDAYQQVPVKMTAEFARKNMPGDVVSSTVENQVKFLLCSDELSEREKSNYSLCLLIEAAERSNQTSRSFAHLKSSFRDVYRYMLDRDKRRAPPEPLLHTLLLKHIRESWAFFSTQNYLQALQILGVPLDEDDKRVLERYEPPSAG